MTRRELVELLYQRPQPTAEIKDRVLDKLELHFCKDKLPTESKDYLIYHTVYGWCLYGFTVKDHWGDDDLVIRKDGSRFNKVVEWASLDFLEG